MFRRNYRFKTYVLKLSLDIRKALLMKVLYLEVYLGKHLKY